MIFAKGSNAILRKGAIIKGGTPFEILESEVEDFKGRGFVIIGETSSEEAESGNINMLPKENPGGKSENNDENNPISLEETAIDSPKVLSGGSSPEAPKMGKTSSKVTSTSTVKTAKKG